MLVLHTAHFAVVSCKKASPQWSMQKRRVQVLVLR